MSDAQHGLKVRQPVHEGVDRERARPVHIQHQPRLAQLLDAQLNTQRLHLAEDAGLLNEHVEFLLVQLSIAIGIALLEATPQEVDECLVLRRMEPALRFLPVRGGLNHAVRGNSSQHRDHGPRHENDEGDEKELHRGACSDDGPGDGDPIVLRSHSEEREQRGAHVAEETLNGFADVLLQLPVSLVEKLSMAKEVGADDCGYEDQQENHREDEHEGATHANQGVEEHR
mmetsp:Transcript_9786/g.25340  ORF Transcript_9786/g.25340 Transcript_9786/m.25340 type:complete len:228 (-) Transcript_9786:206-889(-)